MCSMSLPNMRAIKAKELANTNQKNPRGTFTNTKPNVKIATTQKIITEKIFVSTASIKLKLNSTATGRDNSMNKSMPVL